MSEYRKFTLAVAVCLLAGCHTDPRERAIGQVYVGPASTQMRKDLSLQAEALAELKHGERLEILQFRRRFVKARNLGGTVGWLDSRNLMTQAQVDEIHRLNSLANTLPSQGKATVFDVLNVHTEANRLSPSPYQIQPNEQVDIVAHASAQRVPYKSPVMEMALKPKVPIARKPKRKAKTADEEAALDDEAVKAKLGPPPAPPAPRLPADWVDLSRVGHEAPKGSDADDWALVRLPNGKAGWVLSRNLLMSMPESLLRLANGHRIVAALPLGEVVDGAETKRHWLWATVGDRLRPYQFDSFRVFAYSSKRHRIESVLWEKQLRGFYPLTLEQVKSPEKNSTAMVAGFSVVVEDGDGNRWKRTYAFHNMRAKMVGQEPVEKPFPAPHPSHLLYSSLPFVSSPEVHEDKTIVNRVRGFLNRRPELR